MIGRARETETFFWLVGLGGFGVQTSPAVSQLAASLILGDPLPETLAIDPALYDPRRLDRDRPRD